MLTLLRSDVPSNVLFLERPLTLIPQIDFFCAGVFCLIIRNLRVRKRSVTIQFTHIQRSPVTALVEQFHAHRGMLGLVNIQDGFEKRFCFVDGRQFHLDRKSVV